MQPQKYLTVEEAQGIIDRLTEKYIGEIEALNKRISTDMQRFGRLSHETKLAKKELKKRILAEKDGLNG